MAAQQYIVRVLRGLKANLPAEEQLGRVLFTTDTHEIYVGEGIGIRSNRCRYRCRQSGVQGDRIDPKIQRIPRRLSGVEGRGESGACPGRRRIRSASAPGR